MTMAKEDIAPYQFNCSLKQEFQQLGLDLKEVMEFTPFDLDLENRRLESLLDFVRRYQQYGSQETMELMEGDFLFPPIFPLISPDSDWFRFELWMEGKPTRSTLLEQLPAWVPIKSAEELTDKELEPLLEHLTLAMLEAGFVLELQPDVPPRLVYNYIFETLGETFELDGGGFWHLTGCDGYCPGCFQRPWCDIGLESCWPEDEEAGKICLIDTLQTYVSASPKSLEILQRCQAEEDARIEKFKAENPNPYFENPASVADWQAKYN